MKNLFIRLAFLASVLLAAPAIAQDAGLYDPVAPEGSAFVRFINAGGGEDSFKPSIDGKTYKAVDRGDIGAYLPLKAGKFEAAMGPVKTEGMAESGLFYTAILKGGSLTILKDAPLTNAVKAMIMFYNLSDKTVSLKTADGKIEVIAPVESGKSGSREINAVPVTLAAFEGDKKITDIGAPGLKRNESTAIILDTKSDGVLSSSMTQATTDTKQ